MSENSARTEIKDNEILNNYIKELIDDVGLTQYNLREKSLKCSAIWAKWLAYLYKEKENLQRISDLKQKIKEQKRQKLNQADSILRMKQEDKLMENDEDIKRLTVLGKNTQANIDYIERALNILQNFGFSVKNSIEIFKMNYEH